MRQWSGLYRERAFRVVPLEELLAYYEKAWAEGRWAGDVIERIRYFLSAERRYTVTLSENT